VDDLPNAGRRPSRHSWIVLGVASYGQFAFSAYLLGIGAAAPVLQRQYGLTLAEVSILLGAANLGPLLCALAWGVVNDRFGERWAMTVGLTVSAFLLALVSMATTFVLLCVLLAIASGFGVSSNVSTGRAVVRAFQPPLLGLALGLRQTASPVGGAVAGFTLPTLTAAVGGQAFLVLAGLTLAGAGAAFLWLPRQSPTERLQGMRIRQRLDGRVWRVALASGVLLAPQAVFVGLTPVMLTDTKGVSVATAGAVLGLLQLVGAALRVLYGYASERWTTPVRALRGIIAASAVAVVLTGLAVPASALLLAAVAVVAGGVCMAWNGVAMGLIAGYAGEARSGIALGLQQTMLFSAATASVPLFGLLVEATNWMAAFLLLASAPVLAWALVRSLS
jgi:sugar phosphate permease